METHAANIRPGPYSVLENALDELIRFAEAVKSGVETANYMAALSAVAAMNPCQYHLVEELTQVMQAAGQIGSLEPVGFESGSQFPLPGGTYL